MRPTASPRQCRCGCAGELPLGVGESRRSAREADGRCGAVAGLGGFQASGSWSQDRRSRSRTKAQKSMEVNGPGQDTGLSAGLGLLHSTHLGTAHRHSTTTSCSMRCCVATTGQLIVSCAPCATATPRRSMLYWLRAGAAVPLAAKPRPQNKRSDLTLTQLGHWIGTGRYQRMPVSGAEATLPSADE